MRRAVLPGSLLLLLLGAVVDQAVVLSDYTLLGFSWPGSSPVVGYRINAASFPASIGTTAAIEASLSAAADEWTGQSGADFAWLYEGTTTQTSSSFVPGLSPNTIFWSNTSSGGALAVTLSYYNASGDATGFYIRYYGGTYTFSLSPSGSTFDLQGIATHELGHALGLGHDTNDAAATMWYAVSPGTAGTALRTLELNDRLGAQALYGVAAPAVDLAPASASGPSTVAPGGAAAVTGTLGNSGAGPAPASTLSVVLSTNTTITLSDTLIGSTSVTVPAASVQAFSVSAFVPAGLAPGTYWLGVIADSAGVIAESDEGNNALAGAQVTVAPSSSGPALSSVTPPSGPLSGGTTVTLTGAGFLGGWTGVYFGGVAAASVSVVSDGQITCSAPAGLAIGSVSVVVDKPAGQAVLSPGFTYTASGPTVSAVAPSSGPLSGGTVVTLTGAGFLGGWTGVYFGGVPAAAVNVVSNTQITCTAPAGLSIGSVPVVVDKPAGQGILSPGFTYSASGPTLSVVAPSSGPLSGGTAVTLTGAGFQGGFTGVYFGGVAAAAVSVVSNTQITCTAPAGLTIGTVPVVVDKPAGQAILSSGFTYTAAGPVLLSVSPSSGSSSGGTFVILTGTGFAGGWTGVYFGGQPATSVTVVSTSTLTCVTPAGTAGTVSVVVDKPAGQGILAPGFTYTQPALPAGFVRISEVSLAPILVEIVNVGAPASLAGLRLRVEGPDGIVEWPAGDGMLATGEGRLFAEADPGATAYPACPLPAGVTSLHGAIISLIDPAGSTLDAVSTSSPAPGAPALPFLPGLPVCQRVTEGDSDTTADWLPFDAGTPGFPNFGLRGPSVAVIRVPGVGRAIVMAGGPPSGPFLLAVAERWTLVEPPGAVLDPAAGFRVLADGTGLFDADPGAAFDTRGLAAFMLPDSAPAPDVSLFAQWAAPDPTASGGVALSVPVPIAR